MATAIRTKDIEQFAADEMRVSVPRPTLDHPLTRYGTFGKYGRSHYVTGSTRYQVVNVSWRAYMDNGMLQDLLRRAATNKNGKAVRGPATAQNGRVDVETKRTIPALVAAAATASGHKAMDGPITVRAKLLEPLEPYVPTCRHCRQLPEAHDLAPEGFENTATGEQQAAWWCVVTPTSCQACAAAEGVACDYRCPNRDTRGGKL